MPQQSWTIGSDPACDIVVDNVAVSGQHCRLESDGTVHTLADLDSTNGTFVNGQQLTGVKSISTTDRITLGQTHLMPWPDSIRISDSGQQSVSQPNPVSSQQTDTKTQVITLGRKSDNTIALDESNVSTHHARLTIEDDKIVLEDLGSTNGTSVGQVENKVSRAEVTASDTIFLGSSAFKVADLLARTQTTYVDPVALRSRNQQAARSVASSPVVLASVVASVVLLALLGWFFLRDRQSTLQPPVATLNTPPAPKKFSVETPEMKPDVKVADVPFVETPKPIITQTPEQELVNSLFVIVCSDSDRSTSFRIGTGFSIDSEHVVTSAAVIQAMRRLKESGFPNVVIYSPASKSELTIASAKIHPEYEAASVSARKAQQAHDTIFDNLESKPPTPESFEAVKEQLLAARNKAIRSIERKTTYDVGIINVHQTIGNWLTVANADISLRPNQRVSVTGYAFDIEDPYFDRAEPIEPATMPSRVGSLMKLAPDSASRMMGKGAVQQHEYAYLGSPALNAQGRVVGIYSRPTPSNGEGGDGTMTETFDVALFQRIAECLPGQG